MEVGGGRWRSVGAGGGRWGSVGAVGGDANKSLKNETMRQFCEKRMINQHVMGWILEAIVENDVGFALDLGIYRLAPYIGTPGIRTLYRSSRLPVFSHQVPIFQKPTGSGDLQGNLTNPFFKVLIKTARHIWTCIQK